MNLTDVESSWYPDSAGEWGEVDLGLNWTVPWEGPVAFSVGGIYFHLSAGCQRSGRGRGNRRADPRCGRHAQVSEAPADGSYEVFVEAAAEELPLAPTLRFCHDLDNTDDWIFMLSIGHSFDLIEKLSLDLGAGIGYAGDFYVADNYGDSDAGAAFTHAQLDAALNYAFTEAFSLGLKGSFCALVDEDVRDDVDESAVYPDTEIFFGGVTASYSF
jgi:outer membrane receptor protein involved in Fe transport